MPKTASPTCARCGSEKTRSGERLICAPCNRQRVLRNQKTHPEKVNARHRAWKAQEIREGWTRAQVRKLWERYGITVDEYEQRKVEQGGKCAICHQVSMPLVVDHNHRTTQTRALLCKGCNFGLGSFGEDPARLREAADYLESHSRPA